MRVADRDTGDRHAGGPDIQRLRSGIGDGRRRREPCCREILRDAGLDVGLRVPGQHGNAGSFTRRIRHRFVPLKQQPEVHDPEQDEQEQRKHEGKLDELGPFLASEPAIEVHRSHRVATSPVKIGNAYANLGASLRSSVISGRAAIPATCQ